MLGAWPASQLKGTSLTYLAFQQLRTLGQSLQWIPPFLPVSLAPPAPLPPIPDMASPKERFPCPFSMRGTGQLAFGARLQPTVGACFVLEPTRRLLCGMFIGRTAVFVLVSSLQGSRMDDLIFRQLSVVQCDPPLSSFACQQAHGCAF